MFKRIGPGVLVAAAFIGPGTVTVCTVAGVNHGFGLLWAMLLSIVATVVLQEMAARFGLVSRMGLTSGIKKVVGQRFVRTSLLILVVLAIILGNTAYEAGNIGGAGLGMEAVLGAEYAWLYPWIIGGLGAALLYRGSYKLIEKAFVTLVLLMSLSFVITAFLTRPDLGLIAQGFFQFHLPENGLLTIMALIGTTVVPYNLFLHASLVREKWQSAADLRYARQDTLISVLIGGLVSMSIIISASAIQGDQVLNAADMAKGLEPLYGKAARYLMGIGLFAAGISSAVTAPLAAAFVADSCFGWNKGMKHWKFRAVWLAVLFAGVLTMTLDISVIEVIRLAQVANGLLLPVIAGILLWLVNSRVLMGKFVNKAWYNLLAALILLIVIGLGAKSVLSATGIW